MTGWEEFRTELGVALNEADLLGFEVEERRRIAAATFRVLSLPAEGRPPEDRRGWIPRGVRKQGLFDRRLC